MSNYKKANELLEKYIQNINLRKHCYAVETCMRFYAAPRQASSYAKASEDRQDKPSEIDVEKWAIAGLLHDLDWEMHPTTHPNTAAPILEEAGFDKEIINAVLSHGYPGYSNVERKTLMDHYLFACDELSGFIVAYSLMKPGKLNDIDGAGVAKKLKEKRFAEKVSREDIALGLEEIGLDIVTHANNLIEAMKGDERLGLS